MEIHLDLASASWQVLDHDIELRNGMTTGDRQSLIIKLPDLIYLLDQAKDDGRREQMDEYRRQQDGPGLP